MEYLHKKLKIYLTTLLIILFTFTGCKENFKESNKEQSRRVELKAKDFFDTFADRNN